MLYLVFQNWVTVLLIPFRLFLNLSSPWSLSLYKPVQFTWTPHNIGQKQLFHCLIHYKFFIYNHLNPLNSWFLYIKCSVDSVMFNCCRRTVWYSKIWHWKLRNVSKSWASCVSLTGSLTKCSWPWASFRLPEAINRPCSSARTSEISCLFAMQPTLASPLLSGKVSPVSHVALDLDLDIGDPSLDFWNLDFTLWTSIDASW